MATTANIGPPADQSDAPSASIVRGMLCLSSYAPLFAILTVRFQHTSLRVACAALAALGLAYLVVAVGGIPLRAQPRVYPVTAVKDAGGEVAGYLATYLLPFVVVPSPSTRDLIGYAIFAVVVLAVFMRSELAQINPTLYLVGWRVALIDVNGSDRYLVCRRLPRPPVGVSAVRAAGLLVRKEPSTHA